MSAVIDNIFNKNSEVLFDGYMAACPKKLHQYWLKEVDVPGNRLLDIGSGSGRDAAYFAEKGFDVTAVEPSKNLMYLSQQEHSSESISWIEDKLPSLKLVTGQFDLVLCYAVWMFLTEEERSHGMVRMADLMKPGATLVVSMRMGALGEGMVPYTQEDLIQKARSAGLRPYWKKYHRDAFSRKGVAWKVLLFEKPVR